MEGRLVMRLAKADEGGTVTWKAHGWGRPGEAAGRGLTEGWGHVGEGRKRLDHACSGSRIIIITSHHPDHTNHYSTLLVAFPLAAISSTTITSTAATTTTTTTTAVPAPAPTLAPLLAPSPPTSGLLSAMLTRSMT